MQKLLFILGVLYVTQMNAQLTIQNGLTLTTNGCLITLQGNFINNGTIVGDIGSGWDFAGSTLQTIGGTSTTQFQNLRVINSAGISLSQHAQVNGSIFFQNGKLLLNQYNCTLTPNTTLSGPTANSYVITNGTGVFKQTLPPFNLGIFPVGTAASYSPFVVENYGIEDEYSCRVIDSVYSNYSNGQQLGSACLTQAVNKTWIVSEAVNGGGGIRAIAYWNALDELPTFNRNTVELRHFDNNTLAWNSLGGAVPANSNILYNIGRTYNVGIANLVNRPFAVFNSNAPLPVDWLNFTVTKKENNALLNWQTTNSIRNKHFVVQRSLNGINFQNIATVLANTLQTYNYVDNDINSFAQADKPQSIYYKLQQVDLDGKFSYSDTRKLVISNHQLSVKAFPNPFINQLTVEWNNTVKEQTQIIITNAVGQIVFTQNVNAIMGYNKQNVLLHNLAVGAYQVQVKTSSKTIGIVQLTK